MSKAGFLTPNELSNRWGGRINVRTLANWRTTGSGPPFTKIGGAVLYKEEALEKWEDARTVTSTSNYGKT
ncbi:helix-turn-helix domain-containing protein [Tardiphaga sp. 862_B3_N1_1]|uniref:helix-turn-helix domain-containing protein n=1 Tax=Tardiphaga sp. 862_B3_N1_1 TaxID=3240763 RepID=UPI003F8BE679